MIGEENEAFFSPLPETLWDWDLVETQRYNRRTIAHGSLLRLLLHRRTCEGCLESVPEDNQRTCKAIFLRSQRSVKLLSGDGDGWFKLVVSRNRKRWGSYVFFGYTAFQERLNASTFDCGSNARHHLNESWGTFEAASELSTICCVCYELIGETRSHCKKRVDQWDVILIYTEQEMFVPTGRYKPFFDIEGDSSSSGIVA